MLNVYLKEITLKYLRVLKTIYENNICKIIKIIIKIIVSD